ncbi:MAG: recombinase family protein [Pseudonocardia sp.]|nr:recombinase family protein [Pseudonocardia sp.]
MSRQAAICCRISQDRVGAGLGVERQEADCRALAERLGWDVVDVYRDNDVSAYSGKARPGYVQLLRDVEGGQCDAVIAWHTDRLHRSPVELETFIATCDPRAVPTHTVRAGVLDLSTASGRMTARITGAVARHESEQKGERVRRAKQQAQADGKWLGGRRPFGFEADAHTHRAREAEAIRSATRELLAGHSLRSIMRRWNEAGLRTAAGGVWNTSNLRQMLLRPRNAGLVSQGHAGSQPRIIGPGTWAPIVEHETWDALVGLLSDPSRLTRTRKGGISLRLAGSFLYRCHCGGLVRSGGQRADGGDRYACEHNHMTRLAAPVDAIVFGVIEGLLVRDNVALVAPVEDLSPLRERLAVLRARGEEIAGMFGDPAAGMSAAQFRTANERLNRETRELEAEIGRRSSGSVLAGVADAEDPAAAFRNAEVDRKRAIIGELAEVTLLRSRPGRLAGGRYFDPESVQVEPRK